MKNYVVVVLFFLPFLAYGQNRLYEKVATWQSLYAPTEIRPFNPAVPRMELPGIDREVTAYALRRLDRGQMQYILDKKPEFIRVEVPLSNGQLEHLLLVLSTPYTDEWRAVTSAHPDRPIEYTPGQHYRGIIEGQPSSFAAMSFYEDDIIGVFSGEKPGNQVIGKTYGYSDITFISYNDADVTVPPVLECWTDDLYGALESVEEENASRTISNSSTSSTPCKEIKIYVEADYLMYKEKERSTTRVMQDVNGMFNVVGAIYENEGVNIKVNEIFIWTTQDPYNKQSSYEAIRGFGSRVKDSFDGDLGHLLSRSPNNLGGVGWIDKLCDSYTDFNQQGRVAYSNIGRNYNRLPSYSWSVNVLTHEMGHNLGSYHTHSCRWNGNGTQIDDCGNLFASNNGSRPEGQACFDKDNPIIPDEGGTIMSYCHLNRVGVKFSNGFGEQPGGVIRGKIDHALCLGGAFEAQAFPKGTTPLYYGDSVYLRSIPTGSSYTYQWYLDDTPIAGKTKSTLTVGAPGHYRVEVIKDCSVFSNVINVVGKEYIASINFPVVPGDSGEVKYEVSTQLPSESRDTLLLELPESVLDSLSTQLLNWDVELKTYIKYGRSGDIRMLDMDVLGPANSGVEILKYNPTQGEGRSKRSARYYRTWNQIDPGGIWRFTLHNLNSTDVTRKMSITLTLTLKWKSTSSPSDEDIFQCGSTPALVLDPQLPGDTYRWNTGATTPTIEVTVGGTYTVTVTKGPLTSSDDIDVVIAPMEVEVDTSVCRGTVIELGQLTIDTSGTYTQRVTTEMGCEQEVTWNVSLVEPFISTQEVALCYGELFLGEERFDSDTVDQYMTASNGCDSIVRYLLSVQPEIAPEVRYDTGCYFSPTGVRLLAPEGSHYVYEWKSGEGEDSIAFIEGDRGTVVITSGDCQIEKDIDVPHFPEVQFRAEVSDALCNGESSGSIKFSDIEGWPPLKLLINGKETTLREDSVLLLAGDYVVEWEDGKGCISTRDTLRIGEPEELLLSSSVEDAHPGMKDGAIDIQIAGGTPPYRILWSTGDTTAQLDNLPAGRYEIVVTDGHGCSEQEAYEIMEVTSTKTQGVSEGLTLFPNPADDFIHMAIQFPKLTDVQIVLYDTRGREIRRLTRRGAKVYRVKWSTEGLMDGVYYVRFETSKGLAVRKVSIFK